MYNEVLVLSFCVVGLELIHRKLYINIFYDLFASKRNVMSIWALAFSSLYRPLVSNAVAIVPGVLVGIFADVWGLLFNYKTYFSSNLVKLFSGLSR